MVCDRFHLEVPSGSLFFACDDFGRERLYERDTRIVLATHDLTPVALCSDNEDSSIQFMDGLLGTEDVG